MGEIPKSIRVNEILLVFQEAPHAVAHRLVNTADEFIHFAWEIIQADFIAAFEQSIPINIEILAGSHRILQPLRTDDSAEIATAVPNAWFATFQGARQIEGIAWTVAMIEQNDIAPSLQIGQDLFVKNIGQNGSVGMGGAMRIFKSFRGVVIMSAVVSVLSFCIGLTASYLVSTPVGASVVVVNLLVFLTCCLISKIKRSNARV